MLPRSPSSSQQLDPPGLELNVLEEPAGRRPEGPGDGLSALSSTLPSVSGGSEQEDAEHTRLLSSALSDDGRTEPLIKDKKKRRRFGSWGFRGLRFGRNRAAAPAGEAGNGGGALSPAAEEESPLDGPSTPAEPHEHMAAAPQGAASRRARAAYRARQVLGFLLSNWYKFVILGIIIALIVLVAKRGFSIFGDILRWFQRRNSWGGWGIFIGMYTGLVALFLPGVVFIMGAGFVFGFWKGLLAVWIGGAVGQALAFLLARYLLGGWVEQFVRGKWKKWEYIDKAIELEGWKLVLILRLSPVIPYNLLNVAMATTRIKFWQFAGVSAVGIVYECAVFCYFGSLAKDITSIVSGEAGSRVVEWIMLGLSLVMCIVGAVFVSITIKRAVKKAEVHMSHAALDSLAPGDEELGDSYYYGAAGGGFPAHSTPAALEREAFLGSASGRGSHGGPQHAEQGATFELRAVAGAASVKTPLLEPGRSSGKRGAGGGATAALEPDASPSGGGYVPARKAGEPPSPGPGGRGARSDVELGNASPLRWRPPGAAGAG